MFNARLLPRTLFAILLLTVALAARAGNEIITSPNDQRSYAGFTLSNGLKVLLISDPTTDKAAAAMDVNVGSGSDPKGRNGLAHFLEHMLFLGTEKYPEPDGYQRFISTHGGRDNAFTSFEHTRFFFDIDKRQLEPALDRFAQFFVAPLFPARYVSRERQVVHSEYRARRNTEGRRIYAAEQQAFNPEHPASRFSIGTNKTLADRTGHEVRDDLIAFYRSHYSADLMALTVLGKEPLTVLEQWVRKRFKGIRRTDAKPLRIRVPLFAPGRLPARVDVVPVKNLRRLSLSFPIPEVYTLWRRKPTLLISHLLGNEGKGSLLSALKARGWADGLSAGLGFNQPSGATFEVGISLTRAGLDQVDAIAAEVFRYIELIRDGGVQRWIYDEQQRLSELSFRYQAKGGALAYVRTLAGALQRYPLSQVLRGSYALDEYDPELIRGFLARLVPENMLMTVVAKGLVTDATERWFGTRYRLQAIAARILAGWRAPPPDASLALPAPNPFIPGPLKMVAGGKAVALPERIEQRPGYALWYRKDTEFGLPRADFYFSLRSPIANDTPRHAMLTNLFVDSVNDQLDEFSYPAALAGLNYQLYSHLRGLSVRVSGYSDKQRELLARITATLRAPKFKAVRFQRLKDALVRGLRNRRDDSPSRRAIRALRTLLLNPGWTDAEQLAAAEALTLDDLRAFVPRLLARVQVVALAHGNLDRATARAWEQPLLSDLVAPAKPTTVPRARVTRLEPGERSLRRIEARQSDSAAALYFQGDDKSFAQRARTALLGQVLATPFFKDLRTERKLGYIVYATPFSLLEVPGLAFVVQSPSADSTVLDSEIERFLRTYADTIGDLDAQRFAQQKAGLLTKILERDKQLEARSARYWREIDRRAYRFDSRERLADAVRAVSLAELRTSYKQLLRDAKSRRLAVLAAGSRERAERKTTAAVSGTVIADVHTYKGAHKRFPG